MGFYKCVYMERSFLFIILLLLGICEDWLCSSREDWLTVYILQATEICFDLLPAGAIQEDGYLHKILCTLH